MRLATVLLVCWLISACATPPTALECRLPTPPASLMAVPAPLPPVPADLPERRQ